MKNRIFRAFFLSAVLLSSSTAPFYPLAAQKKMAAITFRLNIDLDATVRCLGSGDTSVPAAAIEGDMIIVSLDSDGTEALIEMTEDGAKPATIDDDSANWKLTGGQEIVFTKPTGGAENAKWDLRQLFAVGTGKLRIKVIGTANNTTPS